MQCLENTQEAETRTKNKNENFFIFRDGQPVTAKNLRNCLQNALKDGGFNYRNYSLHSTRSGRAGDLMRLGVPIEMIKRLGRWKSNAVFRYLKNFITKNQF